MRAASLSVALGSVVWLAACGGGGGGAPGGSQVLGQLVTRDGSADDLAGVVVECPESGEVTVTGADGSFSIDVPADAAFEVRFDDPKVPDDAHATKPHGAPDCEEGEDPEEDSGDIKGAAVELEPLGDGETCEIEVSIEDGEVVEWRETRHDGKDGKEGKDGKDGKAGEDGEERHEGEARLHPGEAYALEGVVGEVEIGFDGCFFAELEVDGFDAAHTLHVVLHGPEGATVELGVLEVNAEGEGHLGLEWCEGDPLPFGVESLRGLEGKLILVLDEEGNVVFEGHVPGLGVDDPEHDGEHEDDDHEGDDPEDGDPHEDGDDHPEDGEHEGDGTTVEKD